MSAVYTIIVYTVVVPSMVSPSSVRQQSAVMQCTAGTLRNSRFGVVLVRGAEGLQAQVVGEFMAV